jgi:hypothetical protein
VYISESTLPAPITNAATSDAAAAIVAPLPKGPETTTLVTSWYQFVQNFGTYNSSYPATFQVASFFQNGGRELYVKRILGSGAVAASAVVQTSGAVTVFTATSKSKGTDGNNLRVQVTAGSAANTWKVVLTEEAGISGPSNYGDDIIRETYDNVVFTPTTSSDYIATVINTVSSRFSVTVGTNGTPVSTVVPFTNGNDGGSIAAADYNVFSSAFGSITRPLVIFLPGVNTTLSTDSDARTAYSAAVTFAESNNGFVIVETDAGLTSTSTPTAQGWADSLGSSYFSAAYYPHIYISDPIGRGTSSTRLIGPSGAVAGTYLDTDANAGVFKAPAGLKAKISGAIALETAVSSSDLDTFAAASKPLNALRSIPGAGLVIMGARTTKQDGSANRYVNIRRSLNYLNNSLKDLTSFALFENNDSRLWAQIRTQVAVFLTQYYNQGGLAGNTLGDAFYIKVDAENNTPTTIQNGEVHIEVGVALQYPAEFIVINLSQKTTN